MEYIFVRKETGLTKKGMLLEFLEDLEEDFKVVTKRFKKLELK